MSLRTVPRGTKNAYEDKKKEGRGTPRRRGLRVQKKSLGGWKGVSGVGGKLSKGNEGDGKE